MKILQIAHGRIYPPFVSAYAMRCYQLFENRERKIISIGGYTFKDEITEEFEQYRSILFTIYAFMKKDRYFEIGISKSPLVRRKFKKRLIELVKDSDVIVFEGPWSFPLVKDFLENKFIVYDAHNVEYILRENNKYQNETYQIEGSLIKRSDLIFSVTNQDIEFFKKIYNVDNNKIILIPHTKPPEKYEWEGYKYNNFVFIGSLYSANIEALNVIENLAEKIPEANFHIIGNLSISKKKKLKNLIFHGTVSEEEKRTIFNKSLAGLNPVLHGSGRNVKMVDYLSFGLPVITTPIGFRGFDNEFWDSLIFIENIENFYDRIKYVLNHKDEIKILSEKIFKRYTEFYNKESLINSFNILIEHYNKK